MTDYLVIFAALFWAVVALVWFCRMTDVVGSVRRLGPFWLIAIALFAVAAGTKPPASPSMSVRTDTPFITLKSAVATSDDVSLEWTYSSMVVGDTLHIDVRPKGSSGEWTSVFVGPVWGQRAANAQRVGAWAGTIPGAVDKECYIWSEYVPGPEVHTNGVFRLEGVTRAMDDETGRKFVTPRITIEEDGEILTPRKDEIK